MHKVMLIDDDVPMLKVLRQMIEWESLGLRVVGTAYSSAKAMLLFQETSPDIVITDIGLPQKNGIELSNAFIGMKPETRVIFLTCHEDFHYAQQAVKLNADDYLLKDQLTAEMLEASLRKSIRLLQSRAQQANGDMLNRSRELHKQALLESVLDGTKLESIPRYAAQIGISWVGPRFMLGVVHLNYASYERNYELANMSLIQYAVYNIATEIAGSHEGITPFLHQERLIILYNYRLNLAENAHLRFREYLDRLRDQCAQFLRLSLSLVAVTDKLVLKAIGAACHQIVGQKSEFYADGRTFIDDLPAYLRRMFFPAPSGFAEQFRIELEQALLKNDGAAAVATVRAMGSAAQAMKIEPNDFLRDLVQLLRGMELLFARGKTDEETYVYLAAARTLRDAVELAARKLMAIGEERQTAASAAAVREPKLHAIQRFIEEHLSENITSIDIAHHLFLNPSYFSRYFKRLTGVNFTDYVHQYKMKIAANLLKSSGQTLEMLAMGLGYSDRTYFSKVFKKYLGQTPSEYKTKHASGR